MKNRLFILSLVVSIALMCLCVSLAGCTSKTKNQATVELKGNPTTGYTWVYTINPEGVVKEVSNKYVSDPNPRGADGVGGTFKFTFGAVAEGEAEIVFYYLPIWENNPASPDKVFRATVDAEGNLKLVEVKK